MEATYDSPAHDPVFFFLAHGRHRKRNILFKYARWSYFVDMTNRTDEEQEYTVTVHFVDADGFSVEDGYAGDAFNKIPAKSTKRLLDRALIDTENAPTVVGILLEVNVR